MFIRTYAFFPGIIACLVFISCLSTPQTAAPVTTGQNNKVETRQEQSIVDLGKEQITKPDVSGSQNKTVTTVNDPKVLYGVMGLLAIMLGGMFQQQRKAHGYQKRRIDIYSDKGHMTPTESKL